MPYTRRRVRAAAALSLAGASLASSGRCGGVVGVDAFYSGGGSTPLAFAPPLARPWIARSVNRRQYGAPLSLSGRVHVREGSGCDSDRTRSAAAPSLPRVAWGALGASPGSRRRGSTFSMAADDAGEKLSSAGTAEGVVEVETFMPAAIQDALPEEIQKELFLINRDPAKLNYVLNAAVIFLFVAFAAFKLATVDGDIARGWTWWEVLLRVPGDNFYRYETTVSESPIPTKALTSCVAYGLGDLTAQLFTGKTLETIDLTRTARSATAGLLVHGPLCHFWIELMQKYLDFDGAWWNVFPKVIADQTVWSVFLNAAYSTMIMGLQGKSPEEVWGHVRDTAWPALTSSWRFWPLIHCCSFSNAIPKDLKLLFIDCMEIIWVTILSTVANGDRERPEEVAALEGGEQGGSLEAASAVAMKPGEIESEKLDNEPIRR